jgi:hypothetical protein
MSPFKAQLTHPSPPAIAVTKGKYRFCAVVKVLFYTLIKHLKNYIFFEYLLIQFLANTQCHSYIISSLNLHAGITYGRNLKTGNDM